MSILLPVLLQNVIFGSNVVTTNDDMSVFKGNALILEGKVNYAKRSSIELEVSAEDEDLDHHS
jgi:hypothetical protein